MSLSYQEVLVSSIGEFGRVQGLIVFACNAPEFIGAWSMIMMSFAGAQPNWWKSSVVFINTTSKKKISFLFLMFFFRGLRDFQWDNDGHRVKYLVFLVFHFILNRQGEVNTAQKNKFSNKNFFSNVIKSATSFGKLHFFVQCD